MKSIIVIIVSVLVIQPLLFSQNSIDNVLKEIESNNTTLSALQKRAEANKIENKIGNSLQNPAVEFNYLWGTPTVIGNRTDFSLTQTFDFPTAYGYKNTISDLQNKQVDLEYQKRRKELIFKARLICVDLIYINSLNKKLAKRLDHAKYIASSYKSKLDVGEANILEYNKAQLNLLNLENEITSVSIKRDVLLGELSTLNGGVIIDFVESEFQIAVIPSDFEQWYEQAEQSNPLLNWLKHEVEIGQQQVRLNKTQRLPKVNAGYMSESVVGQNLKGVTIGLSIPLWENKHKVEYSKIYSMAVEYAATDNEIQLYNHLKAIHGQAAGLQKNLENYRSRLKLVDNSELLNKALGNGEISLIDYVRELSLFHESENKLLGLERDVSKSLAELKQYL